MTNKKKNSTPSDEGKEIEAKKKQPRMKQKTSPALEAALDAVEHMNNPRRN